MQIDSFTIMLVAITAVTLFGAALAFFWMQDRRSRWLAWWAGPFLLGGVALCLFILRGQIDNWWSVGLANAMLGAGFGMAWQGARVFGGRKPWLGAIAVGPVLWLALCAMPGFMESQYMRNVAASCVIATFSLLTANEFWKDRDEYLVSRTAAVVVLLSFALFIGIRVPLAGYLPFPMGALPMNSTWLGIVNLVVLTHVGAFAILMISLTKERREREQRQFAMLDPLTGLMNRRAFMAAVERASRRRIGFGGNPVALLVLDLDHFKLVNDRYGHDVGDRVLMAFAQVAESATRSTDQLYRMGGEEFCCIMPDVELSGAIAAAERIRRSFQAHMVEIKGESLGTTVSIGISVADHAGLDLELMFEAADAALYEAKARGRNQIVVADQTALRRSPSARVFANRRLTA